MMKSVIFLEFLTIQNISLISYERNFCNVEVLQGIDELNCEITLKEENNQKLSTGIPANAILLKLDVSKNQYKQKILFKTWERIHS